MERMDGADGEGLGVIELHGQHEMRHEHRRHDRRAEGRLAGNAPGVHAPALVPGVIILNGIRIQDHELRRDGQLARKDVADLDHVPVGLALLLQALDEFPRLQDLQLRHRPQVVGLRRGAHQAFSLKLWGAGCPTPTSTSTVPMLFFSPASFSAQTSTSKRKPSPFGVLALTTPPVVMISFA